MKLSLQRDPSGDRATLGALRVNGSFRCFTLEDIVRERPGVSVEQWKIPKQTAIPAGTYRVVIDFSEHFERDMMHVLDVPGFEGIRIHSGNTADDTDGCILVGQKVQHASNQSWIRESMAALMDLQPLVQAAVDAGEEVTLEILPAKEVLVS